MSFMGFSKKLWQRQVLKLFRMIQSENESASPSKVHEGQIYVDTSEGMSIVSYHLTLDETNRATIAYQMVSGPDVLVNLLRESS